MLPNPEYRPTFCSQVSRNASVPSHVGSNPGFPECAVRLGQLKMLRAPVPKATIDKDHDFFSGECEIRRPGQRQMPSPAGDSVLFQQPHHLHFSRSVSTDSYRSHDLRSLFLEVDIRHTSFTAGASLSQCNWDCSLPQGAASDAACPSKIALKFRELAAIALDDILNYRQIVIALTETIRLMKEIDEAIDQHGGWPCAFQTNNTKSDSESSANS